MRSYLKMILKTLSEVFCNKLLWSDKDNRFVASLASVDDFSLNVRMIINNFVEAGLLRYRFVNEKEMVEYTHLAILDNWPRLRQWVNHSKGETVDIEQMPKALGITETEKQEGAESDSFDTDMYEQSYSSYRFEETPSNQKNFIDEAHEYVQAEIMGMDEQNDEEDRS